ncbi:MAG: hypothetical protein FJW14_09845 [Acidimicrobiia bacterium]|nr:hypothetical protein [Acidimicrobiia bacterium]
MRHAVRRAAFVVGAAAVAGLALLLWYASSDNLPPSSATALLDSVMPAYGVQEVHSTFVGAPPARTYAAILSVTPGDVGLARPFMWVRTLPARMTGGQGVDDTVWNRPLLSGTAVLAEARDSEIVVGLIGQFWALRSAARVAVESREQFTTFARPGFAVASLSFHVEPAGGGSTVTTITRVRTTDPDSARAFRRYWRLIGTGSGVLRRTWLRAIKTRAERPG